MSLKRTKVYRSLSSEKTKKFGEELARETLKLNRTAGRRNGATVFALKGDLGAGKTTFVQGFLRGLGAKGRAPSPTFVIMRRHLLGRARGTVRSQNRFKNLFHVDAYRLADARHLAALGMKDIFADPENVVLIEWAERAKKILPRDAVWLTFRHGKHENERHITIKGGARRMRAKQK